MAAAALLGAAGSAAGGLGSAASGAASLIPAVFGTSGGGTVVGTSTTTGSTKEKLNISDEAVKKIIADVLGGAGGLAEIFSGEQNAGIFNASATAQAAGDLASKLVGEIAALTAEKETSQSQTTDEDSTTTTSADGLLSSGGAAGGIFENTIIGGLF
jgi:hypothetical protein